MQGIESIDRANVLAKRSNKLVTLCDEQDTTVIETILEWILCPVFNKIVNGAKNAND